jgi:SSS family transporter
VDWLHNHWIQMLFITLYLGLIAYHAWIGQKRSKSLGDYLVGGRSLGGVAIAMSFFATFVSSVTFVGHAGRSYDYGPSWWITCVVIFTSLMFVAWFVVAPPFVKQARIYSSLTVADFLEHRYQSRLLRRLAGFVVVAASVVYMVAVYDGAARLTESLLELDSYLIMAVIFIVVTAYTLSGGFHSVVATDVVQGAILFLGALIVPAAMIWHQGGLLPLIDAAGEANPDSLSWSSETSLFTMIGLALGVAIKFIVEPRQLSRFYGLSSQKELGRGRWLAPALIFLTYLLILPVGFLAHAFIPETTTVVDANGVPHLEKTIKRSDEVVPYLLGTVNVLGPVAGAFFLTALVAAAMSSLDSVLLVAASSIDHDLIAPGREAQAAMKHTRMWVLLLSALAAALALLRLTGIVEMSSFSGSVFATAFFPCLIVGLFWRRGNRAGALASLLVGFAVTTLWFLIRKLELAPAFAWLHEIFLGLVVSLLTYVVVSLLTRPGPPLQESNEMTP